jgi:hypothetical protein
MRIDTRPSNHLDHLIRTFVSTSERAQLAAPVKEQI